MTVEDLAERSTSRWRLRLRFGLKALFVVTTILCVWLGFEIVPARRAAEMSARHKTVLTVLAANITKPMPGTRHRNRLGDHEEIQSALAYNDEDFEWRQFLPNRGPQRITGKRIELDVSDLLKRADRKTIGQQLVGHFEQSLDSLGMTKWQHDDGTSVGGASSRVVWASRDYDFSVVIDVAISADTPAAEVRILLIDAQRSFFW